MSQFQPFQSSSFDTTAAPETEERPAPSPEADQSRAKSKTRPRSNGKALDKASVRRVAAKVLEVETTDAETLAVVAGLLGTPQETVELTVAIMSADRAATQPIKDIQTTFDEAKEDQIMAVLGLNALSVAQVKAMWSTLNAVTGSTRAMPGNERAALNELFKTITGLTEEQELLLEQATELLRRA